MVTGNTRYSLLILKPIFHGKKCLKYPCGLMSIGSKEEKSEKYHFTETEFNSVLDKIFFKKTGKDSRLWGDLKIFFADY